MSITNFSKDEAQRTLEEWKKNPSQLPHITNQLELELRNKLQEQAENIWCDCKEDSQRDYIKDVRMGIELHKYLKENCSFNIRQASDENFWRYLSVIIAPNVVAKRWGIEQSEDRFWRRGTRIWFNSIWWYIELSWQGNYKDTQQLLEMPCFTTDTILNLVERSGKKGTFIEVYRNIMYYYSKVSKEGINNFKNKVNNRDDLFRAIMRLNTAKSNVIEPSLYDNGEVGYVKSLFKDMGIVL